MHTVSASMRLDGSLFVLMIEFLENIKSVPKKSNKADPKKKGKLKTKMKRIKTLNVNGI